MSFPAYPTYRHSGVEWLGEVPTHWSVHRISELYREVAEPGHDELPILSVSIHDGVSDDESESDDDGRKVNRSDDRSKYKQVKPNDLVYNTMRAWQGGFGSVKVMGMVSPAYVVARPRNGAPSSLIELILRTAGAIEEIRRHSKGVTDFRLRLYWDDFKNMRIALPPARERLDVINFLSHEAAKIDVLVKEQRCLMALLKEKRQAVISHAVTKGLNPNAPMKNSGIEWIGEVPAHWERSKVKYETSHVVDCLHTTPTYDGELLFPAIRTADIAPGRLLLDRARLVSQDVYEERIQRLVPMAGDILYSREGERFGMAALVPENVRLCLGQRMMMFRSPPRTCSRYMMWTLNSDAILRQVDLVTGGSTSPHINISDIINFDIPAPPQREQFEISSYIECRTNGLDQAIFIAESAITLLSERRAALISAAVTGKIDVRRSAVVLPCARGLIATEIIKRSAHQATFGRVKLQKIAYLAEAHAGVSELKGVYLREAAGPLDREMIHEMEQEAGALTGVRVEQPNGPGSAVSYRLGDRCGAHHQDLATLLGDRAAKFDKLIDDVGTIDTKGAEAVATLYAVWNDALIDGETPDDMEIKLAVLTEWHPEKAKKFRLDELQIWLDWMRRHGLVPKGTGPRAVSDQAGSYAS